MQIFVEPNNRQNKGHVKYISQKKKRRIHTVHMLWSHGCFFPLVKFLIFSSNYYDDNARIHILVFISHFLNTDKTKDKLQSIHIHKVKFLRFYLLRDTYLIQFLIFHELEDSCSTVPSGGGGGRLLAPPIFSKFITTPHCTFCARDSNACPKDFDEVTL